MEAEYPIEAKTSPFPNRRIAVRREEDVWKIRQTESLEALLTTVRFELKTPLTAARIFVEDLEDLEVLEDLMGRGGKIEGTIPPNHQTIKERRTAYLHRLSYQIKIVQRVLDHMEKEQRSMSAELL